MSSPLPGSLPGVADVEILRGSSAPSDAAPDLLVEVPHGADRRAHYDALRALLVGDLPDDLHEFFHVNTDVGAWQVGRRVAEHVIAADPHRSAVIVRSLIPRTFVDCNRLEDATDDLAKGGMTAGVAPYVRHPDDVRLLLERHRAYTAVAQAAYEAVCGHGGFALVPHTYGPVTLGIEKVDDGIVAALRAAHEPAAYATWPVRPEVDLITRTADGTSYAPEGAEQAVAAALAGFEVAANKTYAMHPSTMGYRWATRWPGRTLCFEVRRDRLVPEWRWSEEMHPDPAMVDRFARPLADLLRSWLA